MAIWAVVLVLSTFTSFIQSSPVHNDSWLPLPTIWEPRLSLGFGRLAAGRWAWGAAWTIGTIGGAIAYMGAVVIFVLTYGS